MYLIRKDEVDIYDIPISSITEQYIKYIEMMKSLDIDLAGDFLVMAATLMQIKSAMLLPKAEPDSIEAEDFDDPRAELIRQLLEYKKFKDAANLLDEAAQEQQQRTPRPGTIIDKLKDTQEPELDLDQVSVWDLLEAFDTILQATGASFDISHITDDTPIDLYQIDLLHKLQSEGPMPFGRIFENCKNRLAMVGMFLGFLELIRDGLAGAEQQEGVSGAIHVTSLTDEEPEKAVQRAIIAAAEELDDIAKAEAVESVESIPAEEPPVPIVEIGSGAEKPSKLESSQANDEAYPIAELPSKEKIRAQSVSEHKQTEDITTSEDGD